MMHGCSKHVDARFHFLLKLTQDGIVQLVYYNTQEQVVDVMTKPLKLDAFVKLWNKLTGSVFTAECKLIVGSNHFNKRC